MDNPFDPLVILNAATAAPATPTSWGLVPTSWKGAVREFDLELDAAGANTITGARLLGGALRTLTVANDAIEGRSGNSLTLTAHGYVTGDGPFVLTTSGTLPTGLFLTSVYWIIVIDANTIRLADSFENAMKGIPVVLSGDGTGTNTIVDIDEAPGVVNTKRLRWLSMGNLGELGTGAITLSAALGYCARVKHRERNVAYAIGTTGFTSVATTAALHAVPLSIAR